MQLPILFSLIYFITFMLHGGFGAYMFYRDPKASLNRVFFVLCISLAIWSFAFSAAVNAPTQEFCLLWRRVASIGVSTYYCLLIHFVILLTNHTWFMKHKKVIPFLYLPAAFFIWVYALSPKTSLAQYNLVRTDLGWIKVSFNGTWDIFYNFYFLIYMLLFVKIIWDWYTSAKKASDKLQAKIIVATFGLVFLLVMATFQYRLQHLTNPFPEITCVIALIPIFSCYYAMKKYHFMTDQTFLVTKERELILMGHHREKVFLYLSTFLMFGGCLNYVSQYLLTGINFGDVFSFSLLLILIGFAFKISQIFISSVKLKEYIAIGVITLLIPLLTFKFVDQSGITIWAISLVFILMSVVFNNRWVIFIVATSSLLTQLSIWILMPSHFVLVNSSDHIVRIGFVGFSIFLAYYINQLYSMRLQELTGEVHFQKMISEVSSELVSINQFNFESKIMHMLLLSGQAFGADLATLHLYDENTKAYSISHEWCKPSSETNPMDHRTVTTQELPIAKADKLLGYIRLTFLTNKTQWEPSDASHLKILANLITDALIKIEAEKEIERMAYFDDLTSLPNRISFKKNLIQKIEMAKGLNHQVAVIFLDLDLFKAVNDTVGHDGGDQLLQKVALRLNRCLEGIGVISRFGGDEFLIILNEIHNQKELHLICQRIMTVFEEPFTVQNHEFFITASAGVSIYPDDGTEVTSLVKFADITLYKAKEQGKNQFLICSESLKNEMAAQIKLTNQLYRALERNEFVLYYQPQIHIQSGEIIGVEALIRWEHPEMRMISPADFIPLAEQTGLITSIGEWVLKTACQQNKAWQNKGLKPIQVAVNLSVQQFTTSNLVQLVNETLVESGLSSEYLELEITESIAIKESADIITTLNKLKSLGISIAIDDFGTEYSSLSRVKQLPIDRLKMAMQFVRGIGKNQKDEAIANVIIRLAKNLNIKIIAEGVETEEQQEFLMNESCDEIQGYYYFKPMKAEEIEPLLKIK